MGPLAAYLRPMREVIYTYLRDQMNAGALKPGMFFNLKEVSQATGVSTTPLREALIQLELEGFVSILPRKGVIVRPLELADVRNIYQLIGALEASALLEIASLMDEVKIEKMEKLNQEMETLLEQERFVEYQQKNLEFHRVYLDLSENVELRHKVEVLKQRLYDFPRIDRLNPEWERDDLKDHRKIVQLLKKKDFLGAAHHIQHVHWSFEVKKAFTIQYYVTQQIERESETLSKETPWKSPTVRSRKTKRDLL